VEKGKTLKELSVGESFQYTTAVTEEMVDKFAEATGDSNPVHLDEDFARQTIFKTRVAHGLLSAGLVSSVLGTRFPGVGTIYISQTLEFKRPVFIGDEITIRLTVLDKDPDRNRLRLETVCLNQKGKVVLTGQAVVMPPV
jgi:3-hydroxybutyryl-CoA dehydratase